MKFLLTLALCAAALLKSAMATPYDSPTRPDETHSLPVRGDDAFYEGRMVGVDLYGYAISPADVAGLLVVGRVRSSIDAAELADGAVRCVFDVGLFAWSNASGDPVTMASYGRPVFIEDDVTVRAGPGDNAVLAGICRGFAQDGKVWVDSKVLPMIGAFFGNHPNANFRISAGSDGAPEMQLYNQDQEVWQRVQLAGETGAEHLIIA